MWKSRHFRPRGRAKEHVPKEIIALGPIGEFPGGECCGSQQAETEQGQADAATPATLNQPVKRGAEGHQPETVER